MAAALGTWSALEQSKPRRIEGHTSNVEHEIQYVQYILGTIGETTEAGDTYIVPHQFNSIAFIDAQPLNATGPVFLFGDSAYGIYYADTATIINSVQSTTAQVAGSTSFHLTTSGSAINDVYNGCWLDIRFSNGDVQTVKITDYVGSTKIATINPGLAQAVAATGTFYTVKGTLATTGEAAATPKVRFRVVGSF